MEIKTLVEIIARNDRDLLASLYDLAVEIDGETEYETHVLELLSGFITKQLRGENE